MLHKVLYSFTVSCNANRRYVHVHPHHTCILNHVNCIPSLNYFLQRLSRVSLVQVKKEEKLTGTKN